MPDKAKKTALSAEENARLILDFFHRTMMHHAMWFSEVQSRFGPEKAFEIMENAWEKSYSIQLKRLSKVLGFGLQNDQPEALMKLPNEKMEQLREAVAVNWLANDGVWFQSVEFTEGMNDAKHCNDAAWGQFSPFEARSIKTLLGLPPNPGLEGLKKALQFRLYAFINEQSFEEETSTSFVFKMNKCRVQYARERKGLNDYPCKSGGLIEYTTFAETIDPRIQTHCIACPPDPHPDEYYCAWKFILKERESTDND